MKNFVCLTTVFLITLLFNGCAAPSLSQKGAKVGIFVGGTASCAELGEVKGFRGDLGGPNDNAGFNRVMNQTADLGGNAIKFLSATDEEFKGIVYSCKDSDKVQYVGVKNRPKMIVGDPDPSCIEIGGVETRVASTQTEAKDILANRAKMMGGNAVRLETAGTREWGGVSVQCSSSAGSANCNKSAGTQLATASATAYYCK